MHIEVDKNNNVLGYSDKPSGTSIYTEENIPNFSDVQVLKFIDNKFLVENSKELEELKLAEPMRRLRKERNRRLAETDWWAMKEVDGWQMSPQQRVYRKKLRDLPETSPYPKLDENNQLTNVDWPEKP